jgi:hypothetical protein
VTLRRPRIETRKFIRAKWLKIHHYTLMQLLQVPQRDIVKVTDAEESSGIVNGWRFAAVNEGMQHLCD